MPFFAGIDIGASSAKLVIIDERRCVIGRALRRSGVNYAETAQLALDEAARQAGITAADLARCFSTGYGRDNVPFAYDRRTEIACHGKAAYHAFPQALTVLDIGAQDCKVIHLDALGRRTSFKMNRKCAAGTGAFLEEIAHRLDLRPSDLNALAERSTHEATLNSFCTVFAATEILERIRAGIKVEDIIKGAFRSVVKRLMEMDTISGALTLTGGVVAHNPALVRLIEEAFGRKALIPPDPQFCGAFGAALFAAESFESSSDPKPLQASNT